MSPGLTARAARAGSRSRRPRPSTRTGRSQLGERGDRLDHGGAAAHVELHLVHVAGRLERDPAGVERDRLADEREQRGVAVRLAGAVVLEPDQPGLLVRALRDRRERAHPRLADRRLRRARSPGCRAAPASSCGVVGERRRGQVVGRRCCRGRGRRFWAVVRIVARRATGSDDVVVGAEHERLDLALAESSATSSACSGRTGRRAAASPRRAPRRRPSPTWWGTSQHSVRRAELARPPVRHRGGHARSLGVELVARSPRPTRIARAPSACVTARRLNSRCASPDVEQRARARLRAGRGRRPRPRTRPPRSCPRRSSSGTVGRRLDLHAARTYQCHYDGLRTHNLEERDKMPKTVILSSRPHADRQARRRPVHRRRDRARRHRDQGRARARRGRARSGPARRDGPGAPGRPGPDPLAPGADQGRDPQGGLLGDDQQGLRVGDPRRRACSTTRSAPATSTSALGGGMESMSKAPYLLKEARFGFRMGDGEGDRRDDQRRARPTRSAASTWRRRRARSAPSSR